MSSNFYCKSVYFINTPLNPYLQHIRGVGKTSFIKRYVNMRFEEEYKASIGVDFALKTIEWDNKTVVRLQLWDTAGQERIRNMSRVYYKEAMGAFVVFDTTKMETLEAASQWKHDLDSKVRLASGSPVPAVLLANKCDQTEGNKELSALMDNYCEEKGFLGWFETSANGEEVRKISVKCNNNSSVSESSVHPHIEFGD
uniref:Ras-related protein Rab n=1 Tax=Hucho hucho TaxID=62062 RepID=A0A4W5PF79_9TELE